MAINENRVIKTLQRANIGMQELKKEGISKTSLIAAIQAIDNVWETNSAALKAKMDVAAGMTLANSFARKISKAWMLEKLGGE